jgi:DNA-binding protein HU-beta
MNQKELINRLSEALDETKVGSKKMLQDTFSVLSDQLKDGKGVSIPNLGTFITKTTPERKVYNPHYDAEMMVPKKRVVEFSPASNLKEEVRDLDTKG